MNVFLKGFGELEDLLERSDADFNSMLRGLYSSENHTLNVDVDVAENSDYIVRAEVPGLKQEAIDISYSESTVLVIADYGEGNAFRKGKYSNKFKLIDVDVEKISAKLEDGILILTLPKDEAKKARKINID